MSTKTLYTCDRCGRETLEDRSYWKEIYLEFDQKGWTACPKCLDQFDLFLNNKPTEITYIEG
jgi:hypothetical protein